MNKNAIQDLFSSKFLNMYDLQYENGRHYYVASRRKKADLAAAKSEEAFRRMLPDAVSCFVILKTKEEERLLLTYEYRYPTGQYLLSVPAGLIDPIDKAESNPILSAAKRELKEETNLRLNPGDEINIINPLVFSTPGMTDESNALVSVVVKRDDFSQLNHDGAEATEKFGRFVLCRKSDAERILKNGRDDQGHFYPLYTWAALMYFLSDLWK